MLFRHLCTCFTFIFWRKKTSNILHFLTDVCCKDVRMLTWMHFSICCNFHLSFIAYLRFTSIINTMQKNRIKKERKRKFFAENGGAKYYSIFICTISNRHSSTFSELNIMNKSQLSFHSVCGVYFEAFDRCYIYLIALSFSAKISGGWESVKNSRSSIQVGILTFIHISIRFYSHIAAMAWFASSNWKAIWACSFECFSF